MSSHPTTMTVATANTDISSWNENILAFDFDRWEKEGLDNLIDETLGLISDPLDPNDPCGQFSCTAYWPM